MVIKQHLVVQTQSQDKVQVTSATLDTSNSTTTNGVLCLFLVIQIQN